MKRKNPGFTLDFAAQTLTLSAKFADAANNPGSKEYRLVRQFQHDFPNLTIVRKTHKTPTRYKNSDGSITTRNKNNNLTYKRMESYMSALLDGKDYLEQYWILREKAKAMCVSPYAAVSGWFMKQFPKFREDPMFYLNHKPEIIIFTEVLEKAKKKPSDDAAEGGKESTSEKKIS